MKLTIVLAIMVCELLVLMPSSLVAAEELSDITCSDWPGIDKQSFIWPEQWSGIQEIHLVSGNFSGAVQRGRIVYDFLNQRTREDQALITGPSVKTDYTSDNMTEWFHNTTWFYMDWTTGECMSNDFGIGMVKPDWLTAPPYPYHTGTSFIYAYVNNTSNRGYVNTTWIQTDGSVGFGLPPNSNLFDWHLNNAGIPVRMRIPSTLAADLMVDISDFRPLVDPQETELPDACLKQARPWLHGPVTPLAHRYAAHHRALASVQSYE